MRSQPPTETPSSSDSALVMSDADCRWAVMLVKIQASGGGLFCCRATRPSCAGHGTYAKPFHDKSRKTRTDFQARHLAWRIAECMWLTLGPAHGGHQNNPARLQNGTRQQHGSLTSQPSTTGQSRGITTFDGSTTYLAGQPLQRAQLGAPVDVHGDQVLRGHICARSRRCTVTATGD